MPKKKESDLTPEEQFKRFQEAAKEHEIEERLPEIERAFGKLASKQKVDRSRRNEPKSSS